MSMGKKSNDATKKSGVALSDETLATVAGGDIDGEMIDGKIFLYYVDGPDPGPATFTTDKDTTRGRP